ncbi:hypothetical protein BS47DRAFT_1326487 [Hydnum rufescens UP504]|uniref:Uncharacterized protein n=1 Tax=Hydnum rufescens UP504 TaxID=1448309 RepID=A0A9P6DXG6_9AGAM|nr:hypothetical protein BS47DRAFT_1326487 [Hydnum rufescens UP504]
MAPRITHCIFDMDGLLIDTERVYTDAANEILSKHQPGTRLTWELKAKLMGRTARESARVFLESTKINMPLEEFLEELLAIQRRLMHSVDLLPGVERLIHHLHNHNIPIAVATSSTRTKLAIKTQAHGDLFSLFDSVTCADDEGITQGKPAPDIFLIARSKLGDPALEDCLIFEDATVGIEAARRAGIPAIWIPDPNLLSLPRDEDFIEPLETLKSMVDFEPSKYGLPAYD